jgi:hypothetical protein
MFYSCFIRAHLWLKFFDADSRTPFQHFAIGAIGLARKTPSSSVPDKPVAEQQPVFLRQQFHQRKFDFFRRQFRDQAEPVRKPHRVRVHNDADNHAERVSQNDVRRLAPDAVELDQFLHRARNFATVTLDEFAATILNVLRLAAEKSGRLDELLQFRARRVREIFRGAIFFEQLRRDEVDALVRALRGKDHGDEQLERVRVSQLAVRVRISLLETGDDFFQPRGFGLERFTEHFSARLTAKTQRHEEKFCVFNFAQKLGEANSIQVQIQLKFLKIHCDSL